MPAESCLKAHEFISCAPAKTEDGDVHHYSETILNSDNQVSGVLNMFNDKTIPSVTLFLLLLFMAVGCTQHNTPVTKENTVNEINLSQYSDAKPEKQIKLLFIHHSCGGQWLADKGDAKDIIPDTCIIASHPNGGGLRALLQKNNYEVHETAYKSAIGNKTDVCDWNAKFRDNMDQILRCDLQDTLYNDASSRNTIVMFKSCFPANEIFSDGKEPGDPDSPQKTLVNYKTAYTKLLVYFRAHPETLFICVTAPPIARNVPSRTREFIKNAIGSESSVKAVGERSRRFNNWLKDGKNGWLAGYELKNVVVFDYYNVLTRHGESNYSLYPTNAGYDSHPSTKGNTIATQEFIPFLNRAVNRFVETH